MMSTGRWLSIENSYFAVAHDRIENGIICQMPSSLSEGDAERRDSSVTGLSPSEMFYPGTGTKSGSAIYKPSRPKVMLTIQALKKEADELWARMKRSLWQEDPAL